MPPQTVAEVIESGNLWLYRTIAVAGTVLLESGSPLINLSNAKLTVEIDDRPWDASTGFLPAGWNRLHSVTRNRKLPRPAVDGAYYVRVPAILGATLIVNAPGLRGSHARIPVTRPTDGPVRIDLTLRNGPHVTGTLSTADGQPVARHSLYVWVTVRTTPDAVDAGAHPHPRFKRQRGSEVDLYYFDREETRPDGTFDLLAPASGELMITAEPPLDHFPLRRALGRIDQGDLRVDLRFEGVSGGARVRFHRGGKLLRNGSIRLTRPGAQEFTRMAFWLPLDENGTLAAALLRPGETYIVNPPSWRVGLRFLSHRLLEWNQADSVEIEELPACGSRGEPLPERSRDTEDKESKR